MARMSQRQKDCRREARRSGARVVWDITNAIHYYRDGIGWQLLGQKHRLDAETVDTANEMAASRFAVSDKLVQQAYDNAKRAAHWATRSTEEK